MSCGATTPTTTPSAENGTAAPPAHKLVTAVTVAQGPMPTSAHATATAVALAASSRLNTATAKALPTRGRTYLWWCCVSPSCVAKHLKHAKKKRGN